MPSQMPPRAAIGSGRRHTRSLPSGGEDRSYSNAHTRHVGIFDSRGQHHGPNLDFTADPAADRLWDRILRDRPHIGRMEPHSFAMANALRDWAYTQTLASARHLLLDACGHYEVYLEPASAILARMDRLEGGFMCGGAAAFLRQVYRALGLSAYAINLGDPATIGTHVVTLVALPGADGACLAVQDPYLNWALVNSDGRPASWPDAARLIRARRVGELSALSGPSTTRRVLLGYPDPGEVNDGEGFAEELARGEPDLLPDTRQAAYTSTRFNLQSFETGPWFRRTRCHRRERFGSDSLLPLLAYPLSTSGEAAVEQLVAELA